MLTQPWCSKNHLIIPQGAQEKANSLAMVTDSEGLIGRVCHQAGFDFPPVNDTQHSRDGELKYRQVMGYSESAGDEAFRCPTVDKCLGGQGASQAREGNG